MMTTAQRFLVLAALSIPLACNEEESSDSETATSTDGNTSGAEGGQGDGGPGGSGLDPMCAPNDGDGITNCSGESCEPGSYCQGLFCEPGCETTLNCPQGSWCDLRMPDGFGAGLCRPTSDPACGGSGDETGFETFEVTTVDGASDTDGDASTTSGSDETADDTCIDVQGNYDVELFSDSPEACFDLFFEIGTECSVAQDECTLTWACDGFNVFPPGPLQSDDTFNPAGTFPGGLEYSCSFDFFFAAWSCAFMVDGGTLVCEGLLN